MILRGHVFSSVLQMETGLAVYAPDRADPAKPRPVVYLLHGLCGRAGDWIDYTMLPVFAHAHDAILVMPEVARSFYADQAVGLKYFTYIADELPEICASTFNIAAEPGNTAVIGVSMGGYGALRLALSRPHRYGCCAAISPACLYLDEGIVGLRQDPEKAKAIFGEQLVTDLAAVFSPAFAWDESYSVRALLRAAMKAPRRPRLSLVCGSEDAMMIDDCRRLRGDLATIGYPVTYEEWPGTHDWTFFNQALQKALAFCRQNA